MRSSIRSSNASPSAAAQFFPLLVFQLVEMTLARERVANVADMVAVDATATFEKRGAVLRQAIAVRGGQTNSRNHNALVILSNTDHDESMGVWRSQRTPVIRGLHDGLRTPEATPASGV